MKIRERIRGIWTFFWGACRIGSELRLSIFEWLLFSGLEKKRR